MPIYHISSNSTPDAYFNIKASTRGAYWKTMLKKGKHLFQRKELLMQNLGNAFFQITIINYYYDIWSVNSKYVKSEYVNSNNASYFHRFIDYTLVPYANYGQISLNGSNLAVLKFEAMRLFQVARYSFTKHKKSLR